MKKALVVFTVLFFIGVSVAIGQEEMLEATLERSSVSVGNPIYLNVTFYGAKNVSKPNLPRMDGLQIKYVGPATRISVVNGRISQSITHSYLIIPLREGDFKIGPFKVEYRGKTYEADAVRLVSSGTPVMSSGKGVGITTSRAPSGLGVTSRSVSKSREMPYEGDRIFLVMNLEKKKMYVNEVVPVTIKLYVDNMRLDDVEYPSFPHEGFSAGAYDKPMRSMGVVRGKRYDVLEFRRNIFGIKEGEYVLGPARVGCKVLVKRQRSSPSRRSIFDDDFFKNMFARYQTYPLELKSNEIPVTILPFPKEGRPESFQGAVGDFNLDVKVDTKKVKVGDPIVVSMIISGKGNLDTVTAPKLKSTENLKVYEPQTSIKADKKIYEQIIIPKTEEVTHVPGISFSFLNPKSGKYEEIDKASIPIEVIKQPEGEKTVKVISMPGAERIFYPPEKLGKDIIYIKENAGRLAPQGSFLFQSRLFWAFQAVPLGLFLIFYALYRKKEKIRKDRGYARLLRAPKKARSGLAKAKSYLTEGNVAQFYDSIFRTLQEYLGDKFNLPKGSITTEAVSENISPAKRGEDILNKLKDVFSKCDMARYASSISDKKEAKEVLEETRRIIDYFEKIRL